MNKDYSLYPDGGSHKIVGVLNNHSSFETAHIIEDYPYGFTLRCKKAMWIEYRKGKGQRVAECTTNPKSVVEKWNAVKHSTYSFIRVLVLLDNDHVVNDGLSFYASADQLHDFCMHYWIWLNSTDRHNLSNLWAIQTKQSPMSYREFMATFEFVYNYEWHSHNGVL